MRIDQLARILQCSTIMLDCARDQRWHEVPVLEAERAQLLKDYAAMPAPLDTDETAIAAEADALDRIIEVNTVLMKLGERHRRHLADELSGTRRQRRAANMYSQSSVPPHFSR